MIEVNDVDHGASETDNYDWMASEVFYIWTMEQAKRLTLIGWQAKNFSLDTENHPITTQGKP